MRDEIPDDHPVGQEIETLACRVDGLRIADGGHRRRHYSDPIRRHRFTIAIPTHDRRETVVLSVLSALRQTRPPEQVLVLCDGCSDGTAEAVRELGDDRVAAVELQKAPGYAYGHRNEALTRARGDLVLWLADDDLLLPDHLERLGEYWDTGEFGIVTAPAAIVHADDSLEWIGQDWSVPWNRNVMERNNTNVMSSVSVSAELALSVGGWDARIPRAADWDLWKRILATGVPAAMTAEATVLHFRAAGREQAWSSRVAQNAGWLERISDPATLRGVQRLLRRLNAQHDADLRRALEEQRNENEAQRRQNEEQRRLNEAQRNQSEEQRRDYEARLTAIHNGGWWRLRERLLPLMRLVGRGDAG